MLFGELIRAHRNSQGLTLTELASKLSMDSANLCKIENGQRNFDPKRLLLLSDSLGIDLSQLEREFYSDIIAKDLFNSEDYEGILKLVESKIIEYQKQMSSDGGIK